MKENKRKKFAQVNIKEHVANNFDIPQEVMSNVPVIRLIGNKEISVENFTGLVEYTEQKIRLSTQSGMLVIDGIKLRAKSMTAEQIIIRGTILQVAFAV